ncbi:MAG: UDP-diphosphatase [Deltaproteobacteria bacterium]|nr:MAG: UDP-diphosphatase [Deltaproteobacteria bacterium]
MTFWQSIFLGILQGVSEFLPISSSGHLVLGQHLMGLAEPDLFFDISLHMGTLGAVFIVFFNDLSHMTAAVFRWMISVCNPLSDNRHPENSDHLHMAVCVIIGSVPTAIIGLLLKNQSHHLFSSVRLVGAMLLVTAMVLWKTAQVHSDAAAAGLTIRKAMLIGMIQGFAVIPGISRSGTTIAAGLFLTLDRDLAARFSFLLSIPAIMGAALISLIELNPQDLHRLPHVGAGTLAAFVSGLIALKLLLKLVHAGRLHRFAPYCAGAGLLALAL